MKSIIIVKNATGTWLFLYLLLISILWTNLGGNHGERGTEKEPPRSEGQEGLEEPQRPGQPAPEERQEEAQEALGRQDHTVRFGAAGGGWLPTKEVNNNHSRLP